MTDPTNPRFPEAMVEIVARAAWCKDQNVLAWDVGPPHWRNSFIDQARAALTALTDAGFVILPREATEEMKEAGADAYLKAIRTARAAYNVRHSYLGSAGSRFRFYSCPEDWLDPLYRAMRDAAMGGKG
jgi:hypothetical protein